MIADVNMHNGAAQGTHHVENILLAADCLLGIQHEMGVIPQGTLHLLQKPEGAAGTPGHILLRHGHAELLPQLCQPVEPLKVQLLGDAAACLVAVEHEDLRPQPVHSLEIHPVKFQGIRHPALILAEKQHGLDGTGKGMQGTAGHVEPLHGVRHAADKGSGAFAHRVDKNLGMGNAADRQVIYRLLQQPGV